MMELLVEAERYLSHGLLDHAERLFRQVADADPKSSIAAVGLARVALERGDDATAYAFARRGLAIDPENPAAHHLVLRLEEVVGGRGETLPTDEQIASITGPSETASAAPPPSAQVTIDSTGDATRQPDPVQDAPAPSARRVGTPARRPGLLGRLFDRRRRR
jgi:predicted Zn-dependent protease